MSLEITVTLKCDGCGFKTEPRVETRITEAEWMCKTLVRDAKGARWMIQQRRYGKPKHLCANCADGKKGPQ